jgi:hypothetical protein
MGNDIGAPSLNLVKNAELFPEYTASKLMDVRESAEFYISTMEVEKKMTVNKLEFDEVILLCENISCVNCCADIQPCIQRL